MWPVGKLQLDEETYRAALMKVCADKTSCQAMTVPELARVLHVFQKSFKVRLKPVLRRVKPASPVVKILAIWQGPCNNSGLYSPAMRQH